MADLPIEQTEKEESKKTQQPQPQNVIELNRGNIDVVMCQLLNDISRKLDKLIEVLDKK